MAFLDTLFMKKKNPKPSLYIDNSSNPLSIAIFSDYYIDDDQIDVIISVVKADLAARVKPKDMAIDIIAYSGIDKPVRVIMTPKGVKVIIGNAKEISF